MISMALVKQLENLANNTGFIAVIKERWYRITTSTLTEHHSLIFMAPIQISVSRV